MTMRRTVTVESIVAIEIDDEVVVRCVENHDENGVPQTDVRGGRGWRNIYYDLDTPEKVFGHLAFNVVRGNVSLSQLDGWADLPSTAMRVTELSNDVAVGESGEPT